MAYLKAPIIDKNNSRISAESCHGDVKAISVLYCTIPSVFTRRCLAAVEVKNMTMKTMNIFLNILLTSDADIKYSHVFIRDFRPFCFVLQTNVLKTKVLKTNVWSENMQGQISYSFKDCFFYVFIFQYCFLLYNAMIWNNLFCFDFHYFILIFNDMSGL